MRQKSSRTLLVPTSRPSLSTRVLKRLGQAGAVAGALVVVGVALDEEPTPPSPQVVAAEQETRAFLDERAANHLRRLRAR